QTACYDMYYSRELTPFLAFAAEAGAQQLADGIGMLVGQAAHAFYLWRGIMPEILPVITQLRQRV
ncbi:MAG: shikimate dehydrogenase, partial [Plesiomonas shigelloides]